ncbi:transcription elongation factor GreA [Candidatus Saccharibacteria bacterium]|nr:transcription elongation factor GreA [Candidatus Saccharibacteria bacterium]
MKKQYQLTADGKKALERELEELKSRRGAIADKIADARDYGDLSENAEYDAAREEQGQVEGRISEIEEILLNANVISNKKSSKVAVGSTIELKAGRKTVKYTLVGPVEANPLEGKISNESPIGTALLGKKAGDKFSLDTPKGKVNYEVVKIG